MNILVPVSWESKKQEFLYDIQLGIELLGLTICEYVTSLGMI